MSDISLPKKKTLEGANLTELVWLVYGQPGIGKTTFASKMGEPLFLYTDPGQRFIEVYKAPVTNWKNFRLFLRKLEKDPPTRYSTIVIDTVDILFNFCKQSIYQKRQIEHASDEEWGKGWELIKDEFTNVIARLCLLPYGIVFISHDKTIEIKGRLTKTNKVVPSLPKNGLAVILPLTDIVGYAGFDEDSADTRDKTRLIYFEPTETLEAKDRTNSLPEKCLLDFEEVKKYLQEGGKDKSKISKDGKSKGQIKKRKKARR